MSDDDAPPANNAGAAVPPDAISRELLIINKRGLHARASAKFVQMVEKFEAEIWVTRGGETVGGTSIMGLMMLSAATGHDDPGFRRRAREAQAALDAITALVADKFNEEGRPSGRRPQNGLVTMPPSTRSAAPLVALDAFEQR